jgi:signal transduction histidine kinase
VHAIKAQFTRAGRTLKLVCPPTVTAFVTASALTQSIEILLDNALVHGSGDVPVTVTKSTAGAVEIAISDEGTFAQAGSADTNGHNGDHRSHGLGLLLARNLLRSDGGRVELVSSSPTTFAIRLPAPSARSERDGVRPVPLCA